MSDGLDCKIDIEVGPVEMPGARKLNIQDLPDGRLAEPWEVPEGHEHLPIF